MLVSFFTHLTVWHWLGLGLVLLTLEVAIGTFDLLWVSVAAFSTALFAWIFPGWASELVWFGITAAILVTLGRTVFKGLRRSAAGHPHLNDRTAALIGKTGEAAAGFEAGKGKVKIGDTVWSAEQLGARSIVAGDAVMVDGADGTTLKVRAI